MHTLRDTHHIQTLVAHYSYLLYNFSSIHRFTVLRSAIADFWYSMLRTPAPKGNVL